MTTQPPIPGTDVLVDVLVEQMQHQPWWRRFANTVSAAAGAVILILWVAVAAGLDVPSDWLGGVSAAIGLLTTLGVLRTPNGLTPRGVDRVAAAAGVEYQGRHRSAEE